MSDSEDELWWLYCAIFLISTVFWLSLSRYDPLSLKAGWSILMICILIRWMHRGSRFALVGVFLFGLCLRLYSQSFSNFEMFQWQDQVQDYLVLNTFIENRGISILPSTGYTELTTFYSSWPLLHALEIGLISMTGFTNFQGVIFTTFYLYLCSFLAIFCTVTARACL